MKRSPLSLAKHLLAVATVGFALTLGACASNPSSRAPHDTYAIPEAATAAPQPISAGSIYAPGQGLSLFEDQKARRVGDVLTVLLVEATSAQKKANTATSRESNVAIPGPTLFGRPVTAGGVPILESNLGAESKFNGGGSSSQSNALSGSLSVLVLQVLPNGNLVVRGEKQLTLNQGSETVFVEGLVRPQDIRADNSLTSDRLANARIRYAGKGAMADANAQGWLSRFFNSALFPF
ncbi:MAG TPA: flagellar basal body L-ring protein FlgH [Solimonas sp.]